VVNYQAAPTIFDTATNRASGIQVVLYLQLTLTEQATGKVLFTRPIMDVRGRYEVSTDERQYFDESEAGIERVCRDAARQVVSAVLEAF
jgi:hypothetical protein